ncbi:MAG: HAD family hydrolase, partial [Gammaproteobacteria bacterium]
VRDVVARWMEQEPLALLPRHKVQGIDPLFAALARSGRRIAAWSDYPVRDKMTAMGLKADIEIWSGDENVNRPKPHPAGLEYIFRATGIKADRALVVGDRVDRDWAAANALSVPSLIRSRKPDRRAPTFRDYTDPVFAPLVMQA